MLLERKREATSALDFDASAELEKLIVENIGRSIANLADEVAILHEGRLLACGLPEQVLTAAYVAQAFGVEAEALRCQDGTGVLVPRRPSVPV